MHSRSCFKRPFGSKRVNVSKTLQKFAREYFYPFLSFWHRQSCKKSLLVGFEISGLIFNPWTANAKYSPHIKGNLPQLNQIQLSKKPINIFVLILLHFENQHVINCLKNILETHSLSIFGIIDSKKRGYFECIAGLVSEYPSEINLLTGCRYCRNHQGSSFILLLHHKEINRARKRPS